MKKNSQNTIIKHNFHERFWMAVGYFSATVTILIVVFQVGQNRGYRNAKKEEFKSFITYLSQIKDGVTITSLTCNKKQMNYGDKCELTATIQNKNPYECDLWFGASIRASNRTEHWSATEDKTVTITSSGITTVKRFLTIPPNITPGTYDLQVNLWYGKISDPVHSERISSAALEQELIITNNSINDTASNPTEKFTETE